MTAKERIDKVIIEWLNSSATIEVATGKLIPLPDDRFIEMMTNAMQQAELNVWQKCYVAVSGHIRDLGAAHPTTWVDEAFADIEKVKP